MILGKKILGHMAEKTVQDASTQLPAEFSVVKTAVQNALAENLAQIQKEIPETVEAQRQAMAGLEQLAKNVKSMIK